MSNSGIKRAAVLMLALGADEAAEVMKFLAPKDMQKLGVEMAKMKSVGQEELKVVMSEFMTEAGQSTQIGLDTDDYIRSVMVKALGEDEASGLLKRILKRGDSTGIDGLRQMDAQTVAEFIKHEHPQIIATILVHLESDHTAEIIGHLSSELRQEVMLRIATLDGIKPIALRELNDVMTKFLTGNDNLKKQSMGGIKVAANIMNFMSGEKEANLMADLKVFDENMAQQIMDQMFVFDNIVDIDDKGIQVILKEVTSDMLVVALKGCSDQLCEKIFTNMSTRAAEALKEDIEAKGPVKLSEVDAQQKQILNVVRRLAEEEIIQIAGKNNEDEYV